VVRCVQVIRCVSGKICSSEKVCSSGKICSSDKVCSSGRDKVCSSDKVCSDYLTIYLVNIQTQFRRSRRFNDPPKLDCSYSIKLLVSSD